MKPAILFLSLNLMLLLAPAQVRPYHGGGAKILGAEQLSTMLTKEMPSVVDLRSEIKDYLMGHIPGAVYLHYESLRLTGDGVPADMHDGELYAKLFSRLGLSMDRPVVIYSAGESNNFYASFLVWLLDGFGHKSVYLLDGGYQKWMNEKRQVERTYPKVKETAFPAKPFKLRMVSWKEVKAAMDSKDAVLVDARPADQFEGKAGAQIRLGHIPGAISHPWSSDLLKSESGTVWKSAEQLREAYASQGITPDKKVIAYCNTGTEASHLYFALTNVLDFHDVTVYVPSFTDWSVREELPVATGP